MIETDYLVVGAGATGLAFADTLVTETDAHVTIVDRHGTPGGHWNDAYPFVTLHQPSAFYGVASLELGSGRTDTSGLNAGLAELASGAEVRGYYDRVLASRLMPTGRVAHHPMCEVDLTAPADGPQSFRSLLTGEVHEVHVRRKVVDATYSSPAVPSTHTPGFSVAPDARLVPPNALPGLWADPEPPTGPRRFVVLGGGKTAMDTCVWLLQTGVDPSCVTWVVPRDSWLLNRVTTQPGAEFFDQTIGGQADQMEAMATATDVEDLFLRLERCGMLTRIDPERTPAMFHLATVAPGEVAVLRRVRDVVRLGRVRELHADRVVLDGGVVPLAPGTLAVDCTASAVHPRPVQPVFQGRRILPHMVRLPQPTFSAALIAHVETHYDDDEHRNRLCAPVPFPNTLDAYPAAMVTSMWNQYHWNQDRELRRWIRSCRLDGFGELVAGADRSDPHVQSVLARLGEQAVAAMGNLTRLVAGGSGAPETG